MPQLSLKYRIAVTIFVLEALMVGVVLWQTTSLSIQAAQVQQATHEDVTLTPIEDMSRIALLTDEYSDVQAFFHKAAGNKLIIHIVLADTNNRIVASTTATDIGRPLPPLLPHEERYWRVRDVGNDSGKMGVLAMEFSHVAMDSAMRHTLNLGISLALGGMVIIAIVGVFMGHLLTRKLGVLAKTARRIAGGDLHAVSGLEGDDEVGEVGRAFDHMARTVETHVGQIKESRESFALSVSGTNDGIWDWNASTGVARFSLRWQAMLGFAENDTEVFDSIQAWKDRIHPDDRPMTQHVWDEYLSGSDEFFVSEHRLRRKSGDYLSVLVRGKALRDENGRVVRMAGSLTDISVRKHQEEVLQYQALHDALTGLPNRSLFHDRLVQAIRIAERELKSLSVLMLDLDDFKQINDTLGHPIGDRVLQEVASRLQGVLRASDTVSRFGGDEFVMLLPGHDSAQALRVVEKIRGVFKSNIQIEGNTLGIDASTGVSVYPQHGTDAHTLIRHADVAMYVAKKSDDDFAIYDSAHDVNIPGRLEMVGQLRRGIENGELILHYQPKVNLRTGVVCGVEALARWQHPHLGLLIPKDFISLAEASSLINPLTYWAIDAALRQHSQWCQQGVEMITAVNLSVRTLHDLDFPEKIAARLEAWGVAPQWFEMEITESAIMSDPERAQKVLTRLDDMGVRLSIDDFGTGHSSLAYLKRLPVDEIKIDRSFISDMLRDDSNTTIVKSTIDLGHNLGMKIVAEGVESVECWNLLRAQGCDAAQGYFISRPMTGDNLVTWLAQWSAQPRIKGLVA